jgi:hypothetical protein
MSGEQRKNRKSNLARALAVGQSTAEWAVQNDVAERTAYRWAKEPKVRAAVEAHRRKFLNQAVGLLSGRLTRAAGAIADLGETAESESVRLSANKAVFSTMITGSKFAVLEQRMTEIEEILNARTGSTVIAS